MLVGEGRYLHTFACVLDGDGAETALGVKIEERVFVEVAGLSNLGWAQLDIECVGIREVFDVHGLYDTTSKLHQLACGISVSHRTETMASTDTGPFV